MVTWAFGKRRFTLRGNDPKRGISLHRKRRVAQLTIDLARKRSLGKSRTNIRRHIGYGDGPVVFFLTAVRQCDRRHEIPR
jgi:hypothetical protein